MLPLGRRTRAALGCACGACDVTLARRGAQDEGRAGTVYGTSLYHVEWSSEEQAILEVRPPAVRQAAQPAAETLFPMSRAER